MYAHSIYSVLSISPSSQEQLKGGYLDFSHLTKLKDITEFFMKKQYKSTIAKNHKIKKNVVFDGVPLKGYVAS